MSEQDKKIYKTILVEAIFATDSGFRFAVMQKAYQLEICGCVSRKGSLGKIEAEGNLENMEIFEKWCKNGPVGCKILTYSSEEGDIKNFTTFDMK
ncbi:MAG: acylphosphatase [Bacteroidetes bacterium]|nr:acylphosphatase [Bacteroidota bacterium]